MNLSVLHHIYKAQFGGVVVWYFFRAVGKQREDLQDNIKYTLNCDGLKYLHKREAEMSSRNLIRSSEQM